MGLFGNIFKKEKISNVLEAGNTLITGKATTRQNNDLNSDSWLSKNIRPIIALYTIILLSIAVMNPTLVNDDATVLLFAVFSDIIKFYFVARTTEKVIRAIIKNY